MRMAPEHRKILPRFDLEYIKGISVEKLLEDYGIKLERNFFKIRAERTASCKYYSETNSWSDFGGSDIRGGGPIQLAQAVEGISWQEAIQVLGQRYDAPVLNAPKSEDKNITDSQYKILGLVGSPVSDNILPTLTNKTQQNILSTIEKYSMGMNQLASTEPATYTSLLTYVALPHVKEHQNIYLQSLHTLALEEKKGVNANEVVLLMNKDFAKQAYEDYSHLYSLLEKVCKGTDLDIKQFRPDYVSDYQSILKKSVEIGEYPYSKLKQLPGENHHQKISLGEYQYLSNAINYEGIKVDAPFSAFVKDETVTISYKAEHGNTIQGLLQSVKYCFNQERSIQADHSISHTNNEHEYE